MAKLRIPALLVLFSSAAAIEAVRLTSLSSLNNADIWWHLSAGWWMLQHHSFPHSGIFSQLSAQPWIATSWAYELLLAGAYKAFGLAAIPLLLLLFKTALAVITFLLAGGLRGKFWSALCLSIAAQYILGCVQPGPAYVSLLFFGIELLLLLEAQRNGTARILWWLVPLFLAWANVHMQFVYGVVLLLVFLLATLYKTSNIDQRLRIADVGKITAAALGATVVTPYLLGSYRTFFKIAFSSANGYLPDFQALGFRQPQDYLLLLLAMAAFLALGLRRSRNPFQIAGLALALGLSFYSRRDVWIVVLVSLAVLGDALTSRTETEADALEKLPAYKRSLWIAVAAAVAVICVFVLRVPRDRKALLAKAGASYPVAASDYIRSHRLPPPLFNAYEWGGFLTWYLPEDAVAIDSRSELYGADTITEYSRMMNAEVPYTEYPAVAKAQTVLLPKKANMAVALSSVPRFQVSYSDDVAVVLTRKDAP